MQTQSNTKKGKRKKRGALKTLIHIVRTVILVLQVRHLMRMGSKACEHCFFRGLGPIHCWGGYAGGFAGPEFVEGLASRGFAARLWLRGVASPGFADVCSTNISDVCAPMLLNQVESMPKGAIQGGKRSIELQD